MTIALDSIPSFTAVEAREAAEREFGLAGEVRPLPSERDQNFLITEPRGGKFVLKIANSNDAAQLLDFQNSAMRHVGSALAECRVQRAVCSRRGAEIAHIGNPRTGNGHCLRLLTWIDGEVLANTPSREPGLLESIGANLARVDAALRDFSHPAMHRTLQWDLRQARMARENTGLLPERRRMRVERLFDLWEKMDWAALRHGVIHGDANDYNVIVAGGRMVGLLDFGDMLHTAIVCDLAIALAYTLLDETEPLTAAKRVIGAYHRCQPLTAAEQRALFPLMSTRLAMSVCYSAHNRARNPGDPYQVVSEAAAWGLLDKLEDVTAEDAAAVVHAACGTAAAA